MSPIMTGVRARMAGICRSFGPQIMPTMPRMMEPMPNVTITMAMNGRPSIGRKANRSISRAMAMEPSDCDDDAEEDAQRERHGGGVEEIGRQHHHLAHGEIEGAR